jgi:predicted phosphodiesterase
MLLLLLLLLLRDEQRLIYKIATASLPYHRLDSIQRVFCISDLHADHPDNLLWLYKQCHPSTSLLRENDLVVVAGDISHDLPTFRATLQILHEASCQILFVPGNHEAWLSSLPRRRRTSNSSSSSNTPSSANSSPSCTTTTKQGDDDAQDSLEKLDQIYDTCHEMGVYTETLLIGASTVHPLWLVPLQSWYDGSLSLEGCEDLCRDFGRWPWVDFQRCLWPLPFLPAPATSDSPRIPMGLNDFFLQRNHESLEYVAQQIREFSSSSSSSSTIRQSSIMTISHFLPNQQCLPDWKDVNSPRFLRNEWLDHGAAEISAKFAKVAGSIGLDQQLRSMLHDTNEKLDDVCRHIHVFGHSHRPKDFEYKDIRYIHNPLGKPRERQLHMVNPNVNFQLVWDVSFGEIRAETPVIRYWEEQGGGKDALRKRMAQPLSRLPSSRSTVLQEQVLRVSYSNSSSSSNISSSSHRLGLDNASATAAVTNPLPSKSATTTTTSSRVAVLMSDNSTRTDSLHET